MGFMQSLLFCVMGSSVSLLGLFFCQDKDTEDNSDGQDEGQDGAPPCGEGTDQPCETQKFQSMRGKDRRSLSLVKKLFVFFYAYFFILFSFILTYCCLYLAFLSLPLLYSIVILLLERLVVSYKIDIV